MKPISKIIGKTVNIFPEPKKALGLLGVGTGRKIYKDRDKDGVKDIFDCAPSNPNKQGITHRVGKWVAKKVGAKKTEEYITKREKESEEIKKIRGEERYKQRLETAKLKEQERGRRQREYIKGGGLWGMTRKSVVSAAKAVAPSKKVRVDKGYRTVYKKKGKHYVKTKVPSVSKPYKPFSFEDMPRIPI